MSIANWNAITQYKVGDQVYDGSNDYYYANADNINSNPPSANWTLIPPPGVGVASLNALTGNLSLVGAGGTTITPGVPGATDITISSAVVPPNPVGFGGWYSQTTQTLADAGGIGAGVKKYMFYDAQSIAPVDTTLMKGTTGTMSAIKVGSAGTWQLTTSLQLDKFGGGGTDDFKVWVEVNSNPVAWSNSQSSLTQQISTIFTCDYMLTLNAGDIVEVVAYVEPGSDHDQVLAVPIDLTHPVDIPSIITNILRIQ